MNKFYKVTTVNRTQGKIQEAYLKAQLKAN